MPLQKNQKRKKATSGRREKRFASKAKKRINHDDSGKKDMQLKEV